MRQPVQKFSTCAVAQRTHKRRFCECGSQVGKFYAHERIYLPSLVLRYSALIRYTFFVRHLFSLSSISSVPVVCSGKNNSQFLIIFKHALV